MKESDASPTKKRRHFPCQQLPEGKLQRNYYTMRRKTFQALLQNNKRKEPDMNYDSFNLLDTRIQATEKNLYETNGEYALAVERSKELFENIAPMIHHQENLTITAGDCLDVCEYLEWMDAATVTAKRELYKQGYLDCVELLVKLGVLRG